MLTRGNGVVTSYTYDPASRLASLEQDPSGSSHDTTFSFDHNPAGQITERTRTNGAYDWAVPSSFNDSYSANGLDEYTSVDGVTPSYDARGNLTDDGTTTYDYDLDNRLTSASGVSLEYDPRGRLHEVVGGATKRFLYDGADVIAEQDASGTVLRRYVHGPGVDEPLVWYEGSGTNDRRWLLADERGSVIGITDDSRSVPQVNTYNAYGVPGAGNDGRFQYTGQMWLEEVGVYHYKNRAYDPELGRFLQPDPIGSAGSINLYGYAENDPINRTDPAGLCARRIQTGWFTPGAGQPTTEESPTVTGFPIYRCFENVLPDISQPGRPRTQENPDRGGGGPMGQPDQPDERQGKTGRRFYSQPAGGKPVSISIIRERSKRPSL